MHIIRIITAKLAYEIDFDILNRHYLLVLWKILSKWVDVYFRYHFKPCFKFKSCAERPSYILPASQRDHIKESKKRQMCCTFTFTCFTIIVLFPAFWWCVFMHDALVFVHAHFSLPATFFRSIFSLGFSSLFIVDLLSVRSAAALSASSCLLKTYLRYVLHAASLLIDRSSLEKTICTPNIVIEFFFSWCASFNIDGPNLLMKIIAVLGKP